MPICDSCNRRVKVLHPNLGVCGECVKAMRKPKPNHGKKAVRFLRWRG